MHIRHMVSVIAVLGFATAASAQTPWEKYLDLPSPENARNVQTASYTRSSTDRDRLYENLGVLEVQMDAGDREAVRLAFRLYCKADGHYAETLDIMLGRLIRINPRFFLEELRYQRDKPAPRPPRDCRGAVNGGPLANPGAEYARSFTADAYEIERRIASLKTVTNPDLRQLRDSCVVILQYQLEEDRKHPEP